MRSFHGIFSFRGRPRVSTHRRCRPYHHHLFDDTPPRGTIARLNALLAAQVRADDPKSALLLFRRMHGDGAPLDGYSFTPALAACAPLPPSDGGGRSLLVGRQLHALGVKNGSLSGHITGTALLDMYAKCDGERPDDAVRVFDEMKSPSRDVVAWNALLSCFVRHGRAAEAVSTFRSMTMDEGVEATGFTLATLLKACGSLKARPLGEQAHASLVVTADARNSVVLGTALVDFYSDCGLLDHAMQVFDHLGCRKDDATYSALINACVRNRRYAEAFAMLKKTETNATALTTALSACSECCNLQYGKQMHCVAIRRGFACNTMLCNALLDVYAKCGAIGEARWVFELTREKNVVSWTSVIHAYGSHGRGAEAVSLFREMTEGGEACRVSPNAATFLSVLSACGHAGLVDEGRACFASMRERHGLEPGPEHYACVIDVLGRAGRIEEAWDLFVGVSGRGSPATRGVCVAMLNACGACMDVVKGEMVAARLLALESPGVYVLLSNFYAAVGMWEKVEELRRVMKERGLRKQRGSSWVVAECGEAAAAANRTCPLLKTACWEWCRSSAVRT